MQLPLSVQPKLWSVAEGYIRHWFSMEAQSSPNVIFTCEGTERAWEEMGFLGLVFQCLQGMYKHGTPWRSLRGLDALSWAETWCSLHRAMANHT